MSSVKERKNKVMEDTPLFKLADKIIDGMDHSDLWRYAYDGILRHLEGTDEDTLMEEFEENGFFEDLEEKS